MATYVCSCCSEANDSKAHMTKPNVKSMRNATANAIRYFLSFNFHHASGEPHWPGRFIEVELRPVSGMDDRSSSRERNLDLKDSVKVGPNGDRQRHVSRFVDQMRNWDATSSHGLDPRALLLYVLYGPTYGR